MEILQNGAKPRWVCRSWWLEEGEGNGYTTLRVILKRWEELWLETSPLEYLQV